MWEFLESSPAIPITVVNTLAGGPSPTERAMVAVVDTGYSGFVLLPPHIFRDLGFDDLRRESSRAQLANGSVVELSSAYGTVVMTELAMRADGRIQTCDGAEEVLIGMDGIRGLALTVDCCNKVSYARVC